MKCPNCPDAALLMTERQGVEIDYCPLCRGVWLDRGELDKLIDRAAVPDTDRTEAAPAQQPYDYRQSRLDSDGYGRRKKSWMSDIFD